MGNGPKKIYIPKKPFYDGPSAILRPLCNINMPKVPIVKWSQNLNFVARSVISGVPNIMEMHAFLKS